MDQKIKELLVRILNKFDVQGLYDTIEPVNPHGVYIYVRNLDRWVKVGIDGYFKPALDGVYVVYFDNAKCGACRIYDLFWFPFVKLVGNYSNVYYVVTLCEWFARNCKDDSAIETFKFYDVHASPTTVLIAVKNGEVVDKEKIEGIKRMHELSSVIEKFALKHSFKI